MSWYIDSWCVMDGRAFASERETGSLSQDSTSTVLITPPDFRPLPVRGTPTALWATRGRFQERLYNEESGEEVAFDTLEQLTEAVRRAYLNGGSDSPPQPLGGGPGEPPDEDERAQFDHPDPPPVPGEPWEIVQELLPRLGSSGDRRKLESKLLRLLEASDPSGSTESALRILADWTRFELLLRVTDDAPDWFERLAQAVTWSDLLTNAVLADPHEPPPPPHVPQGSPPPHVPQGSRYTRLREAVDEGFWWRFARGVFQDQLARSLVNGILFDVPVPRSWSPKLPEHFSLGAYFFEHVADRLTLAKPLTAIEFLPLLLVARVLSGVGVPLAWPHYFNSVSLPEVNKRAARWLADALPGTQLLNHESERIVSDLESPKPRKQAPPTSHGHGASHS